MFEPHKTCLLDLVNFWRSKVALAERRYVDARRSVYTNLEKQDLVNRALQITVDTEPDIIIAKEVYEQVLEVWAILESLPELRKIINTPYTVKPPTYQQYKIIFRHCSVWLYNNCETLQNYYALYP